MKIIIANSKNWFNLIGDFPSDHDLKFINDCHELTKEQLDKFSPDLIFFPHWSWIVPEEIHQRYKCIIFHTAPLPYGRGGSPIQNLILRGFHSSPVCALRMDSSLDGGDVYGRIDVDLTGNLTKIFEDINIAINKLILFLISDDIFPIPQKGEVVNFRRLTNSDNEIKSGLTLNNIFDRIRMVDHKEYPDAFCYSGDLKIEFSNAKLGLDELFCTAKVSKIVSEGEP